MSETSEQRLQRYHEELAFLYRNKITDKSRTEPYWVRIDQLEEAARREALLRERGDRG